jgi:hypothetical protein
VKFLKAVILFSFIALFVGCEFFNKPIDKTPIARVGKSYLYLEDVKEQLPEKASKQESALIMNNIINHWATQQLLIEGALINIPEDTQKRFNKLVEQYKTDLYTKSYQEGLVKKSLDTIVSDEEALKEYDANKEAFKLNEELIKFSYIWVNEANEGVSKLKERFKRYDSTDRKVLDSMSIQFKNYSLNDSVWIKLSQAVNKIPAIDLSNRNQLLKKSNFIQLKDSLGVYLVRIQDVLERNDIAPLEFVRPTIDQIVINKRKLEIIKQLEKDITKDAIKNKQFEIYK